jgi:hypothetical protein
MLEAIHPRDWLRPLMQKLNDANVSLPWFGWRHVAVGFAASCPRVKDARPVLTKALEVGSDYSGITGGVWC